MSSNSLGRYRRIYPRLFRHPAFKALTPLGKCLTLYVLCGPQSNRIGLFHFSVNEAAEDLQTTPQSLKKALVELAGSFGWTFDAAARVFYIPSWWRWNPPDHIHILEGNLKDLSEIPPCALVDAFLANTEHLTPKLHGTFLEACRGRLARPSGSQYQYQDSVTETGTVAGDGASQRPASVKRATDTEGFDERTTTLLRAAREAVRLVPNPRAGNDELLDAFHYVYREPFTPDEAKRALNTALVERRSQEQIGVRR